MLKNHTYPSGVSESMTDVTKTAALDAGIDGHAPR